MLLLFPISEGLVILLFLVILFSVLIFLDRNFVNLFLAHKYIKEGYNESPQPKQFDKMPFFDKIKYFVFLFRLENLIDKYHKLGVRNMNMLRDSFFRFFLNQATQKKYFLTGMQRLNLKPNPNRIPQISLLKKTLNLIGDVYDANEQTALIHLAFFVTDKEFINDLILALNRNSKQKCKHLTR